MDLIQDLAALEALLASNGVDTSGWGTGDTKNLAMLWDEIVTGESAIRQNPLRRVVPGIVQIIIRHNGRMLIEAEQMLADGRIRQRNHPPAEKMLPGESATEAVIRCLGEELNVEPDAIELIGSAVVRQHTVAMSRSYPGLLSEYTIHQVEARVSGLPETDFWTVERPGDGTQTVKKHHWVWRPIRGRLN